MWNFLKRVVTGIAFCVIFWAVYLWCPVVYFTMLLAGITAIVVLFEWKNFYSPLSAKFWLILPAYPLLPFVLLMILNQQPHYRYLLFYLFILAFAHDTGSYFFGVIFGKHRILPSISPKKTWEGFWGGYLSALIALYMVLLERGIQKTWFFLFTYTLISCAIFLVGDLFESSFKRRAGIKDSGCLLPGHGGFLDRFDGILFAAFFVYVLKDYLVTLF